MNRPKVVHMNPIKADKGSIVKFSHANKLITNLEGCEYYLSTIQANSSKRWRIHNIANIVIFSIIGNCFIDWKDSETDEISSLLLVPAVNNDLLDYSSYPIIRIPSQLEFRIRNDFPQLSILGCYSDIKHDPKELSEKKNL